MSLSFLALLSNFKYKDIRVSGIDLYGAPFVYTIRFGDIEGNQCIDAAVKFCYFPTWGSHK